MGYIHICCHMAWFRVVIQAPRQVFVVHYFFLFCKIEAEDCLKLHLFWVLIVLDYRKLLSWAWLTCLFFIPEMILKSAASALQVMCVSLPDLFTVIYFILVIALQLLCFWLSRIIWCWIVRKVENSLVTMICN